MFVYKHGEMILPLTPQTFIHVDRERYMLFIDRIPLQFVSEIEMYVFLEEILYILDTYFPSSRDNSLRKFETNYDEIIKFINENYVLKNY